MSKATRRKYVVDEVLVQELKLPTENQSVVKVIASKGNNLHEVESGDATRFLMSMPPKYRKSVWIKQGHYVLVEPIEEGDKVKAEMVAVLTPEHIDFFAKGGAWPERFSSALKQNVQELCSDSSDSDAGLEKNMNRPKMSDQWTSSDDDSSADDEESDSGQESRAK